MQHTIERFDLDTARQIPGAIDVTQWGRAEIHFIAIGTPVGSGVIEAVMAHDPDGLHCESFDTAVNLDLDSSSITPIDVSDAAHLAFDITTASASRSGKILVKLSQPVRGQYWEMNLDVSDTVRVGVIPMQDDRLFVHARGREVNTTAAVEIQRAIDPDHPVAFTTPVIPTIGTGRVSITTGHGLSLPVICTAAQAGQSLVLHIYSRKKNLNEAASDVGTEWPDDPYDGQGHTRTDLEGERFRWYASRGKWLGELVPFQASRASSASSGDLSTRAAGGQQMSSATGWPFQHLMCVVGCEIMTSNTMSGDIDLVRGSTKIATLLTLSSERGKADDTLNVNIEGNVAWPGKYPEIVGIIGLCANPILTMYMRRDATAL